MDPWDSIENRIETTQMTSRTERAGEMKRDAKSIPRLLVWKMEWTAEVREHRRRSRSGGTRNN